jgi:predicted nucleic acid-binding protein
MASTHDGASACAPLKRNHQREPFKRFFRRIGRCAERSGGTTRPLRLRASQAVKKRFVDAFYLLALLHPGDSWHAEALQFEATLGEEDLLVVTHEIFTEVLAAVSRNRILRRAAVHLVRRIKADPEKLQIKVITPSETLFERGLSLYERRLDKQYSLTDCISMVVMEEEGITEVLTHDHHFEQEGFRILFS